MSRPDKVVNTDDTEGRLWPSHDYTEQVERLTGAIGKKIYLIEIKPTEYNTGIRMVDRAYELLGVIDFPRPDPAKGITPHLILLDDGRGVNLGHIARITVSTLFNPPPESVIYLDNALMQNLLLRDRRLSSASIAAKSRALLGRILGKPIDESVDDGQRIIGNYDSHNSDSDK